MASLREIFEKHNGKLLNKWEHYIDVYDRYLEKYKNRPIVFLEIGVAHGGSLEMWRAYFGKQAVLIGVDVNPECKKFEEENTRIYIGSQEDKVFLSNLKKEIPTVDVLLDDGGHTMKQQITTFNSLFDHVKDEGLYICEDLHTSYWKAYNGGYKNKNSFIEFSKNFIDNLHGWHAESKSRKLMFNHLTKMIYGIHYYDSMLIIEKKQMSPPKNTFKGTEQLSHHLIGFGQKVSFRKKVRKLLRSMLGKK